MRILFIFVLLAMCGGGAALSGALLGVEKYKHNRWVKFAFFFYLACIFLVFK